VSESTETIEKGVEINTITLVRIEEKIDEGHLDAREIED
jgi:hypothetical protein